MSWHSKPFRHVDARPGLLAVGGLVDLPSFGLAFEDLRALPAEDQVRNVGVFASQARCSPPPLEGVRIAAILKHVGVQPEAILVNVRGRSGFEASVWRREIERLAIIAYARGGAPLPPEFGGPFRLVLPGFADEARDVWDLAVLEFAERGVTRARNRRGQVPARPQQPGEVQGGLPRAVPDPADPRGLIAPPPR